MSALCLANFESQILYSGGQKRIVTGDRFGLLDLLTYLCRLKLVLLLVALGKLLELGIERFDLLTRPDHFSRIDPLAQGHIGRFAVR